MHRSPHLLLLAAGALLLGQPAAAAGPEPAGPDERLLQKAGIGTQGDALLDYFRKRIVTPEAWERMRSLVQQLGAPSYQARERASAELVNLGEVVRPLLQQALKDSDLEVVRRAEECLARIGAADGGTAARLVTKRRPPGAAEVLLAYLPFAPDEGVAEEVRTALAAVMSDDRRPLQILLASYGGGLLAPALVYERQSAERAVVAALADTTSSVRRGAAADVLCRVGATAHLPAVRKLLRDPEPSVRLRAAVGLAMAGEREAVPVLIELLAQLPNGPVQQVESLLYQLARQDAPPTPLGRGEAARRQCRDAWMTWWRAHGATADLARLRTSPRLLGYTLVVLLDVGRVMELDADGRPRWQIDGVEFPLDAQMLPGDRVLLAEHNANRVTERDRRGEIVWEKKVEQPLVAQRLPNGNTFIATQSHFVEVDPRGNEVLTLAPPNGELVMKAQKLPTGEIACVTTVSISQQSRFLRLDVTRNNEPKGFPVNVRTYGGRIDVLPNGNVLVPEHIHNRVVEYDPAGKVVWEATVSQPVAAVRLPNGNTLVTSMNEFRAVEIDRTGKVQTWEYKAETRVTRAFRR